MMPAATFNINQRAVIDFTNRLSKMHKSDLPLAVRSTLNDAAFETKRKIPFFFKEKFIVRKKTFIRSHTGIQKCQNTFELSQMVAKTGIIKGKSKAGDDLVKQEIGGTLSNSLYIPLKSARIGQSERKLVSKKNYLKKIKGGAGQRTYQNNAFRKAAIKAGKGSLIRFNDLVVRIDAIKTRPLFIKSTAVYYIKNGKMVTIRPRPFIRPAAKIAAKEMDNFYKKNAEYRIKKRMAKFMK